MGVSLVEGSRRQKPFSARPMTGIDFPEAQLTLVEQLGLQLYAQKHVGELEGD